MEKMEKIVKKCLEKYIGGNKYFHELDELIKYDSEILQEMLDMAGNGRIIILSGAFGLNMVHHISAQEKFYGYILLSGSPRKNEDVEIYATNLYGGKRDFPKAIFLDDTYFSGKTYFYCKGYVEGKFGIKLDSALVAYDGCKHKQKTVESLYRYYDYFDFNGKPL